MLRVAPVAPSVDHVVHLQDGDDGGEAKKPAESAALLVGLNPQAMEAEEAK